MHSPDTLSQFDFGLIQSDVSSKLRRLADAVDAKEVRVTEIEEELTAKLDEFHISRFTVTYVVDKTKIKSVF